MPYATDKNGNHIIDINNNKIEFTIKYSDNKDIIKYKEPIHIDENDSLNTEGRYLVIKPAIHDDQLDDINNSKYSKEEIDNKLLALENKITASINSLKSQINELRILIGYNKINNHMPSNFNSNR